MNAINIQKSTPNWSYVLFRIYSADIGEEYYKFCSGMCLSLLMLLGIYASCIGDNPSCYITEFINIRRSIFWSQITLPEHSSKNSPQLKSRILVSKYITI
ncbi:hypothetical protein C922_05177 [Plasmodium inui San Antonio 1]|uniref:Uncharacterized protein n=1 Tax=Plasmodium inui San Antonio 1 TaxID=1237626 RepID=W6ZYK5_9APIC|nr:hypothetical protein C922_05177 [Plasmodium inui San Antonio 1]EUD64433.1 hypothetical protein C922_05177 [Plasmodium inui San Antonio 1]